MNEYRFAAADGAREPLYRAVQIHEKSGIAELFEPRAKIRLRVVRHREAAGR